MKTRLTLFIALLLPQFAWAISGTGSSTNPYLISTASDLMQFAAIVNATNGQPDACAQLTADITLTDAWTAIGTSTTPYTGTFDGKGHRISGLSLNATDKNRGGHGLFGYISGATLRSFSLEGSINASVDNIGSVAGTVKGNAQIIDVASNVGIRLTAATQHIGGIVGSLGVSDSDAPTLSGCAYGGVMDLSNASDSNGGIVGYCMKNSKPTITYCLFSGSIKTTANNARVGGILGYADDDGSKSFRSLSDCYSFGTIQTGSGTSDVGAIAGCPRGNVPSAITNNYYLSGMTTNALGNSKSSSSTQAITIKAAAQGSGSVEQRFINPTSTTAPMLVLTPVGNEGYGFVRWMSGNSTAQRSFALNSNVNETAIFGKSTAKAVFYHDNNSLVFYYDALSYEGSNVNSYPILGGENTPGWLAAFSGITSVKFDASFKNYRPTSCYRWFASMSNLVTISGIENLNTSEVTIMTDMFSGCKSMKSIDLRRFDTSKVTTMEYMFCDCPLLTSLDLSSFTTTNVTTMEYMFDGCTSLASLDLSSFTTTNVTTMGYMFQGCSSLASLDLSSFTTSNVTTMGYMFKGCSSLASLTINKFDMSNCWYYTEMFSGCSSLNTLTLKSVPFLAKSSFDEQFSGKGKTVNCVLDANSSYFEGSNYLPTITNCNHYYNQAAATVATCTEPAYSGRQCKVCGVMYEKHQTSPALGHSFPQVYTVDRAATCATQGSKHRDCTHEGCTYSEVQTIPILTHEFVEKVSSKYLYQDATCSSASLYYRSCSLCGTSENDADNAFADPNGKTLPHTWHGADMNCTVCGVDCPVSGTNTSGTCTWTLYENGLLRVEPNDGESGKISYISMSPWNYYKSKISYVDFIGEVNIEYCDGLFSNCLYLKEANLSNLHTSQASKMPDLFGGCKSLTSLDLSSFNTSKVTTMSFMFSGCESLTSLDLSSFDTHNVHNMSGMFKNCKSLKNLTLGNFDMGSVNETGFADMFAGCCPNGAKMNLSFSSIPYLTDGTFNTLNVGEIVFKIDEESLISRYDINYLPSAEKEYFIIDCSHNTNEWCTFTLPFDISSSDGDLYELVADDEGMSVLTPVSSPVVPANTPVFARRFTLNKEYEFESGVLTTQLNQFAVESDTYRTPFIQAVADETKQIRIIGNYTADDIAALTRLILDGTPTSAEVRLYDQNDDSVLTVADLTALIRLVGE